MTVLVSENCFVDICYFTSNAAIETREITGDRLRSKRPTIRGQKRAGIQGRKRPGILNAKNMERSALIRLLIQPMRKK
jgi:hypothetical protein